MKKKCLVISAHIPSAGAREAGHKVAYYNIEQLAKDFLVDVIVYANKLSDNERSDLEKVARRIILCRINIFDKLSGVAKNLISIPPRFSTRLCSKSLMLIQEIIDKNNYDVVCFEFSQAAALVLKLNINIEKRAVFHDVQLQVVLRSERLIDKFFCRSTYICESKIINLLDAVTVLSGKDLSLVKGVYSAKNITLSHPRFSDFVYKVCRSKGAIEDNSVLFWGAMNRYENYESVYHFLKNVFPGIKERIPNFRLYIVGNAPPKKIVQFESSDIVITGFVDDPTPYFERCTLGIAPLLYGAGVKIKVLEMLAAGMPVLATPIAAEGISDQKLVEVSIDGFADAIVAYFGSSK